MSVLVLKADIRQHEWHVRCVPKMDIRHLMSLDKGRARSPGSRCGCRATRGLRGAGDIMGRFDARTSVEL
jgi:hypothetical protein